MAWIPWRAQEPPTRSSKRRLPGREAGQPPLGDERSYSMVLEYDTLSGFEQTTQQLPRRRWANWKSLIDLRVTRGGSGSW